MKKSIFYILFFTICAIKGQTTYLMNNTAVLLVCPSTSLFYDSGGLAGQYANNENFTKTFTAPAGQCLSVTFQNIVIEACCDNLNVHDGPTTGSPLLASLNGNIPGPITYISTGGSLTFHFTSDGSIVKAGWEATITCQSACSTAPSSGTASAAVSNATCIGNPSTNTVVLTATGASPLSCGISYNWQSAPTISGPWTGIGTTNPLTTTYSTTIFYRMKVNCNLVANAFSNTLSIPAPTLTAPACDLSTYGAASIPYNFDVFVGTTLPTTDDVLFNSIVNFGFPFCYGGSQYWGGYVASNCAFVFDAVPCFPNIDFNTYAAGGVATGYTIPNAAPVNGTSIPRNAVLAPWHDTNPSLGGTMRYGTLGVAPNRRFVVSWESIPMFSCGTASPAIYYTGQVKLYETTHDIEIHVGNKGLCPGWNGQDAVMGLHSYDGTIYIPPVNAVANNFPTNWTMTNTAYKFTSPCASVSGPCVTLPVNFKNFYGQQIEAVNKLTWETVVEENVTEFIVERSTDAINFTEIGRTLPNSKPSKYDFNDATFKANIINYYKITSVENNGRKKSTFTLPIGGNYENINVSEIYPNPVKDNFTLSYNAKTESETDVTVKDMFGRIVITSHHSIAIGNTQTTINCPELRSGVYVVEVYDNNKKVISQQKLIVVN